MIKVRVSKVGITGASSLIAFGGLSSGLVGCSNPEPTEDIGSSESAYTVQNPGTGVFNLEWTYGGAGYTFAATNSTDEYVRALEQMSFNVPAFFLWQKLYPGTSLPADITRLKQLEAKVGVVAYKNGASFDKTTVDANGWTGEAPWTLTTSTKTFLVNKQAQSLKFELTITDKADPQAKLVLPESTFLPVTVIGGKLPNKTALFDSNGSAFRTRLLEGGTVVRGADLAIAYTDWRAATLIDSSTLDRNIGSHTSYGRFGSYEVQMVGDIEYEVSYGVAIDGVWQGGEKVLAANANSALLTGYMRTAFEGALFVPGNANKLEIYFHVKAFLKVDYSKYSNINWRKFDNGARVLLREKWDNEHGAYADNYDLLTEQ